MAIQVDSTTVIDDSRNLTNVTGASANYWQEKVVTLSGTSPTIDVTLGSVFTLTTSGTTTFSFANVPSASGTAIGITVELTAGSSHTVNWPSSVDWPGGSAPDAPESGETDIYVFFTRDAGTTWYGVLSGDAMG